MIAFPDTSFLFALYRQQDNSRPAIAHVTGLTEALHVSGLLLYELRQSFRFQLWLQRQNSRRGIGEKECDKALNDLQSDLDKGALVIAGADWAAVLHTAQGLSASYTKAGGHRALDILHVATALHLGARDFLTFDSNQRKLAAAEGLKVKP